MKINSVSDIVRVQAAYNKVEKWLKPKTTDVLVKSSPGVEVSISEEAQALCKAAQDSLVK